MVALSSLVSRLLGVLRDRILAGQFGAGDTLDIYYAAFRIPDLVYNLLVLGALSAGFIPIFTELIKNHNPGKRDSGQNKPAWALSNNILNILVVFLIILCGLGAIFAPYITKLITPGFGAEKIAMTSVLTRIMFLSPLFLGISSVFGGILQSFKRFFIYSLSPIFYNIGIIFGALYLVPRFGVFGLAWGVVLGAFVHMIIQLPVLINLGYKYHFTFNLKDKMAQKIGLMMIPRTMSLAISQINLLVITVIASTLSSGSLSVFNFANNLQSFPIGLFGISFAVAAFPAMSAVAFNKEKLIKNLSLTTRQILFFIVPATVLLLTLRVQIIRVILGTGEFDWEDTLLTMNTLSFFSLSLFAQSLIPLLVRAFYARHDSKTPFFIGLASATVNIFLSLWLSRKMGVAGLALAFSVANVLNYILLWLALHMEIGNLDETKILISTIKFTAAAVVCGLAVQNVKYLVSSFVDMERFWGVATQGLSAAIAGIVMYFVICILLESEEMRLFIRSINRRLPWKKIETGDRSEARGV